MFGDGRNIGVTVPAQPEAARLMITPCQDRDLSSRAPAGGRPRPASAAVAPAMAAAIAVVIALGLLHMSWGAPGAAHNSSFVAARGGFHPGLGLTASWDAWSPPTASGSGRTVSAAECPERFVDAAGALLSHCGSGLSAPGQSLVATLSPHALALQAALDALGRGDVAAARSEARKIDVVAEHLVSWMAAISGAVPLASSEIAKTIATLGDWPDQTLLRARYEQALARERPDTATVLAAFARTPPTTAAGVALLANAIAEAGRQREADDLIRRYWREEVTAADAEETILSSFGSALTAADHKARVARLIYQGKIADAERAARLLDKAPRDFVAAWLAVTRQRVGAAGLLDRVAAEQRQDPAYLFARIQVLHQAGKIVEAAALMQSAPTDPQALIDPDAWSQERRSLARAIADADPRVALSLTSGELGASADERLESQLAAGWYALRSLNEPMAAEQHFRDAVSLATTASAKAQAEYWLGRTCDALGLSVGASEHYREAGRFPVTFYGQLALARLGVSDLPIAPPPHIDAGSERRFLARELVQAAGRLAALGRLADAQIFYQRLAEILTDPAEIALLATMAQGQDNYPLALRLGKVASAKQAGVDALAFPVSVVPVPERADVELPAIYAVARQESEFQMRAVSPVGAQGLLQLMPATAQEVAGRLGLPYSKERLGADPSYNVSSAPRFSEVFSPNSMAPMP